MMTVCVWLAHAHVSFTHVHAHEFQTHMHKIHTRVCACEYQACVCEIHARVRGGGLADESNLMQRQLSAAKFNAESEKLWQKSHRNAATGLVWIK